MVGQLQTSVHTWYKRFEDRSAVHSATLALVWLTMATSGLVLSEPCLTDVFSILLILLLPIVGLVRIGPALGLLMLTWAGSCSLELMSSFAAMDFTKAVTHTSVSIYLAAASIIIAGFVAAKPEEHLKLIFNGLTVAAVVAVTAGIVGYFNVFPDADAFTKFGRASGTFKDPNVFGPFLVPAILYAIARALEQRPSQCLGSLVLAGYLAFGVFLSFSRGAWINLIVSIGIFMTLSFVTAGTNRQRQKIMLLGLFSAGLIAAVVAAALQIEQVSSLLSQRASVAQDYDVGPEGRFGGQQLAINLILDNPFGIGASQFAGFRHHEEVHNVYLSMMLNAGWIGAGLYVIAVAATIAIGLYTALQKKGLAHAFLLIATAAFAANAFEGIIIDTDHWRHFYLLMAIVWGIAAAPQRQAVTNWRLHQQRSCVVQA